MTWRAKVAITSWAALVAAMLLAPAPARAFPAFARKYGLRCTACHESWPKLNDFGRAFRDNGYQLLTGKDDTIFETPGYWPASVRLTPQYLYTQVTNQPTDQGIEESRFRWCRPDRYGPPDRWNALPERVVSRRADRIRSGRNRRSGVGMGSLRQPFRLVVGELQAGPSRSGSASLGSPALESHRHGLSHLQLSRQRVPLRASTWGRTSGVWSTWATTGEALNRVAVSVFNVQNSPGTENFWSTPGVYAHATHEWLFDGEVRSRRPRSASSAPTRHGRRPPHERRRADTRDGRQSRAVDEDRRRGPDLVRAARHAVPPHPRLRARRGQPGSDPGRDPKRDIQRWLTPSSAGRSLSRTSSSRGTTSARTPSRASRALPRTSAT